MAEETAPRPLAVDGLATEAQPPAPAPAPELEKQVLLILVGLPGSSKSTFANALAGSSREPEWAQTSSVSTHTTRSVSRRQWTRVSQDEAPSRRRQECERQVIEALRRGENVVVDRVNFDPSQRAHFIALAEAAVPRPRIYGLTLDVSVPTLQTRLGERLSHPTIPDAETGIRVLNQMTALWDPPRPNRAEGFDRVYTLPESRQPAGGAWTSDLLSAVLVDIEEQSKAETGPRVFSQSTPSRGRGGYGGRGRGYSNGEHRGGRGGHWNQQPYQPRFDAGPGSRGAYSHYTQPHPYTQAGRGGYRPQHTYASSPYGPQPSTGYPPAPRPPFGTPYAPRPPPHAPTTSWRRQPDSGNLP